MKYWCPVSTVCKHPQFSVKLTLTETSKKVLIYDSPLFNFSPLAFNEMDENHDGKISQSEFVEVSSELTINGLSGEYNQCVTGLYGSEEVLHNVNPQDH